MADSNTKSKPQLPPLYQRPVVLDKRVHNKVSVRSDMTFSFAAKVNAVPVNLIELPEIMRYYPIGFTADDSATPLAILGLRDNENLFVDKNGQWQPDTYIPAYVRRYPFIFSGQPGNDNLTLCIDDANDVLQKNQNNTLFNDDGVPTDLTNRGLEFCKSYQAAADQTEQFSKALQASGVLMDRQANVQTTDGKTMNLSGFRQIDKEKYHALSSEIIFEWHQKYWIPCVYAHFFSDANWQKLMKLLHERDAG